MKNLYILFSFIVISCQPNKAEWETLILDEKLRAKLSLNSLKHVRENFNFEYTLKTYIKIYDTLLM